MAKQFKKAPKKIQKIVKKVVPARSGKTTVSHGGKVTMPTGEYVSAIGRRKVATARVRLYKQAGDFVINDRPMAEYFAPMIGPEVRFMLPFRVTDTMGKFAVTAKTSGSGSASQLDAVVLGISRALIKIDEGYRPMLKAAGLLTRDSRMKESRKPNTGGKARRQRQSPKR